MKRGDLAYAESLTCSVTDLMKWRLRTLVAAAVGREFESPHERANSQLPALPLLRRELAVVVEAVGAAARERAAQLVAEGVAARLAVGDGKKWLAAERALAGREQQEFDCYAAEQRARHRSARTPSKQSAARVAVRDRIRALRLPSLNA